MSEYSLLESSIKIDDLISFAVTNNLKELVLTDHNNMFGAAEFIHKCKKNDINPIVGVDLDVENFRLILIAKNYDGFLHLIKLVSKKNFNLDIEVKDIDSENLIIIDHPQFGYSNESKPNLKLRNFFTTHDNSIASHIDVHFTRFLYEEDVNTIKIIDSIKTNKIQDKVVGSSYKILNNECETYEQIKKIVQICKIEFPQNNNPIPKFDKSSESKVLFRKIINENAKLILEDKLKDKRYIDRLRNEVKIIENLKFEDYFLIIHDLVKWSKKNKILIGPGRGSASGSLVSYILNITEVDPIEYGLLFERFLNPERITMPDIDIDIQDNKREYVIKYLIEKYGVENVGLISTFQRLATKGSLREVGRMMNIPINDILTITKLIKSNWTFDQAFKESARFRAIINSNEEYLKLFNSAKKIEGLPKNLGTHAAGIVISDNALKTFVPIVKSSEGYTQIQYSMDFLEENGLLKIDLLGLRNLTIIEDIQNEIYKNHNRSIVLSKIPLNDKKTNENLTSGNTNGIFQLESYGMKRTLEQVKISSLNDLASVISLFRPGPMEFIKKYADIKNNKIKQEIIDVEYDKIVKPTYGIMVYQEQIMQIAQKYASMSFGRADILRRAIGKKNLKLIESIKNEFIEGALKNNNKKEQALKIFELIERFANYGFNKSHAISYAILGYRMAYLKTWFPFEFYTSLIKSSISSPITLKQYIFEAKKTKVNIISPQINICKNMVYNKKPNIYLPLSIIKGLGYVANFKIIEEREKNGKFKDFFGFVARLRKNGISESIILSIIKSNALLEWGNMTSLIDSLPQAVRYASMITKTIDNKKVLDFEILNKPRILNSQPNLSLEIKNENEVIGFNISLFVTTPYERKVKIKDIENYKQEIVVVNILKNNAFMDKNGNNMGKFLLQDSSMEVEAFAFKDVYKFIEKIKKGQIVEFLLENRNSKYVIQKNWKVINEK